MSKIGRSLAGTEVPAVLKAGDRVDVIDGAYFGNWGIVARQHLPSFYWVKLNGSDARTDLRLFARKQLNSTPKP